MHIKDGGDLSVPGAAEDDVTFGFNVWTVMDEVMNPNVEYDEEKGGLIVEKPLKEGEPFCLPEGIGEELFYKVEHEETVTLPRYLQPYGLKRASFRIYLDPALINALRVIEKLGLRSLKPVSVPGGTVVPRDVVGRLCPPAGRHRRRNDRPHVCGRALYRQKRGAGARSLFVSDLQQRAFGARLGHPGRGHPNRVRRGAGR